MRRQLGGGAGSGAAGLCSLPERPLDEGALLATFTLGSVSAPARSSPGTTPATRERETESL